MRFELDSTKQQLSIVPRYEALVRLLCFVLIQFGFDFMFSIECLCVRVKVDDGCFEQWQGTQSAPWVGAQQTECISVC